jgi:hypothetical protein
LPPLNNPNVRSDTAAADLPNLASVGNAHVESLAEEFFDSREHDGGDVDDDFFEEEGAPDTTDASPLAGRSLFEGDQPGAAQITGGNEDGGAASSANFANFPSEIPTLKNRLANQDSTLNDEGYDSEGNLPFFADEEQDDIEGYDEPHTAARASHGFRSRRKFGVRPSRRTSTSPSSVGISATNTTTR